MFKKILYPLDIEDVNDSEMHGIVRMQAQANNAELYLMTVIPDHGFHNLITNLSSKGESEFIEMYKKRMFDLIQTEFSNHDNLNISKHIIIKSGNIYKNIVETVKDLNIDLVTIPAHKPGLEEYLLGPNTAKVVRHSPCSVFVIRRY